MAHVPEAVLVLAFLGILWLIGRREADWRSRKPKSWTPNMGPLIRVRPWIFPCAWASITVGLAGLPLAFAGDHVDSVIVGYASFAVMAFLLESNCRFPLLEAALPVPSGATVRPSKGPYAYWAQTTGVLLLLLIPAVVFDVGVRDVRLVVTFCAFPLGLGVSSLIRGRRVVRWENEHGVEILRTRWQFGPQELYVRPRSTANVDHAATDRPASRTPEGT